MKCKIVNISRGAVAVNNAEIADTFWRRFSGLMLRKSIESDMALVFYNTGGIHTMFMRFSLDLIFADRNMKIVRIYRNILPWRMVWCLGSYVAIEMIGNSTLDKFNIGDIIEVKC